MSKFLHVSLSPTPSGDEDSPSTSSNLAWCLSFAFAEPRAYDAFDALFRQTINLSPGARPPIRQWKAEIDSDDDDDDDDEHFAFNCKSAHFDSVDVSYSLRDLHDVIFPTTLNDLDLDSQLGNRQSDFEMVCLTSNTLLWSLALTKNIQRVARALHPLLLSNFLDSAPSVFTLSSGPNQTELGIISAVADIYRNLYGPLLQSSKVRICESSRSPLLTGFSSPAPTQVFF
jgi:pre-rRNA-processing protein IPI1